MPFGSTSTQRRRHGGGGGGGSGGVGANISEGSPGTLGDKPPVDNLAIVHLAVLFRDDAALLSSPEDCGWLSCYTVHIYDSEFKGWYTMEMPPDAGVDFGIQDDTVEIYKAAVEFYNFNSDDSDDGDEPQGKIHDVLQMLAVVKRSKFGGWKPR